MIPLLTAVHVLSVLIWIGGVAFVTIIVFPMIVRMEDSMEKVMFFQGVEHRFAKIAKACVAVSGLTGVELLRLSGKWQILFTARGTGVTLMVLMWTLYVMVLLFEGRLFKLLFKGDAQHDTAEIFKKLSTFHWVILSLSLLTVFAGVYNAHGG
jgi:uncharacterized membrane protein